MKQAKKSGKHIGMLMMVKFSGSYTNTDARITVDSPFSVRDWKIQYVTAEWEPRQWESSWNLPQFLSEK